MQLWLNKGKYGDGLSKALFSENVYREMTSPQTIIQVNGPGPYNTHFAAYGLGFFLSDVKGFKQITHTGGLEGMVTQITMIPELNLGIIVLTNQQEGGAFTSIANQIKDGYFGIAGTNRVNEYSTIRRNQLAVATHLVDSVCVVKWKDRSMDADAFVNFSLDEEGKPSGMKMRAISPLTDFSYDFHDLDFQRVKN